MPIEEKIPKDPSGTNKNNKIILAPKIKFCKKYKSDRLIAMNIFDVIDIKELDNKHNKNKIVPLNNSAQNKTEKIPRMRDDANTNTMLLEITMSRLSSGRKRIIY